MDFINLLFKIYIWELKIIGRVLHKKTTLVNKTFIFHFLWGFPIFALEAFFFFYPFNPSSHCKEFFMLP